MATTRRVSVQDAESVYRRLQRILDVLDGLPTQQEITATGGAKDSMYVMGFNAQLMSRTYELSSVVEFLRSTTQSSLAEIRRTLEQILETDAAAAAEANKLTAGVEGLPGAAGLHTQRIAGRPVPGPPNTRLGR